MDIYALFLQRAFDTGFRLGGQHQIIWESFEAAHRLARFDFPMDIPMEYLARSVEIALTRYMEHDGPRFQLGRACWDEAVAESSFVAALEALRIIFIDEAGPS